MILAAGLSPAWQQIMCFERLEPGEVNRAREVHWCASGKVLNVGLALRHLGAESRTLSIVGGASGRQIQHEFALLNISSRWIESQSPTRICTTLLDGESGRTTELVENAGRLNDAELEAFVSAYRQEAARASLVVLTGSLPAGAGSDFYRRLLLETPCPALLDVRGPELASVLDLKPLVVKPNREELAYTVGRALQSDTDLVAAMQELNRRGAGWVVVSQGRGTLWASTSEMVYRAQPASVPVVNPIGCGDCLAAGMAWSLDRGDEPPTALRYGLAAAAENARQLLPARLDTDRVQALAETIDVERVMPG